MDSRLVNHRYRIVRELGKGGFGATFLVQDTQLPSGKYCVLKELLPIDNNEQTYTLIKQRFEREAVILEELGNMSSQIPSLYAYFTEDTKFYLVQEYFEGDTIGQRVMSQGMMPDAAVRQWLSGILPVLDSVHQKRIIHRDIKPENIILRQRDHQPVLIDFGAVRETMGLQLQPNGKSTQSIVIGTPGFMPSEQAAGRAVFGSDLYSLGLTAIYALTGKLPQELLTNPMTGEIEWRQYAPTISVGLASVIDKAISPGIQSRFQTATQMLDALRATEVSNATSAGMPAGMPGTVMSMPTSGAMPTQVTSYPHNMAPHNMAPPSGGPQPTVVASTPMNYPPQSQAGYPSQPQSQYPPQPPTGYPPQPQTGYPSQPQTGYPPQPQSNYSPQPQPQPGSAQKIDRSKWSLIAVALLGVLGLTALGSKHLLSSNSTKDSSPTTENNEKKADNKGGSKFSDVKDVPELTVRYGGSTSFAPVRSREFVGRINQAHPKFILSYTKPIAPDKPGSGNGIKMLIEGQMSVTESSRPLKETEYTQAKDRGFALEQIPIALDGIAIYVNPQLTVPSLTLAQLKDIFTGKVTNWKDLGGPDLPITAVSRSPKDGGTPEYFEEKVMEKTPFAPAIQDSFAPTTTESLRRIGSTPGGIGYAAAAEVCNQSTVKTLPLPKDSGQPISPCNGKTVNKADFANDAYPITRRLFVIVRKDGQLDEKAGRAYANLLLSDEGQDEMEKLGMVPFKTR